MSVTITTLKLITRGVQVKRTCDEISGAKVIDICRLDKQYGDVTFSHSKTFHWCKDSKEGYTSMNEVV